MLDYQALEPPAIVVTASRAEEKASRHAGQRHVIDGKRIERLGAPLVPDLLRLVPSVAVATAGPRDRDPGPDPRRRGRPHLALRRGHSGQRPRRRQRAALRAAKCRPCQPDRGRARAAVRALGIRGDRRRGRGQWGGTGLRRHAGLCRGRQPRHLARRGPDRVSAMPTTACRLASPANAAMASTASMATATGTAISNFGLRCRAAIACHPFAAWRIRLCP